LVGDDVDRLWRWVVSKIIARVVIFGCIIAAIMIFSRLVDQAYEISPWVVKVLIALLICCLVYAGNEDGHKRKRIEELEAKLKKGPERRA
jgi:hypothetical protein